MVSVRTKGVPKNATRDGFLIVMHGLGQGIGFGLGVVRISSIL
jgi:hypothetical protein